jgi:hypothetical protein
LSIGHINLSEVGLNYVEVFDVSLPSGFKNLDNVDGISVEVDTTGMTEANFVVKNIKAVNVPVNYEVSVDTVQISGVHMVGWKMSWKICRPMILSPKLIFLNGKSHPVRIICLSKLPRGQRAGLGAGRIYRSGDDQRKITAGGVPGTAGHSSSYQRKIYVNSNSFYQDIYSRDRQRSSEKSDPFAWHFGGLRSIRPYCENIAGRKKTD